MTDELTDAVRRLKELQADVERLKAGDDQRGVPRLLFSQSETAVGSDRTDTRSRDVISVETGVASDRQSELTLQDLQQSDVAEARDAQTDLRKQRTVEDGFYNTAGYNVATIDPQVTITRVQQSETGVASDRIDIRSRDLQQSYNSAGYNTATYG